MGAALEFIRGRGWRLSAFVVGLLGLFVGGWATVVLDSEGGGYAWVIAIGFAGVMTLLLIPGSSPQRRRQRNADRTGSDRISA